ncbi:MAG: hypothetical protein ACRESI_06655 [Gammaproteobacteria bacterium]
MNATGWMPDDILDRLTWQEVGELSDYWRDHPPLQWMLQAFLGIKPKPKPSKPGVFAQFVQSLNRK